MLTEAIRDISTPLAHLRKSPALPYVHLFNRSDSTSKVHVDQGAVHGGEPQAIRTTQAILGKFDDDQEWAASILDKLEAY